MSRQAQQVAARRDFWLYIDEFANFISPSMAEILAGARKYRLGLTLAHHELQQLERDKDVASAVMSHPFTRVVFRVSDSDAKRLSEGFSHFEAKDLQNLEAGRAICRVERSDFDFNLSVPLPAEADRAVGQARRQEVITASRRKYGMARADVEAMLAKSRATMPPTQPPMVQPTVPNPPPMPPTPLPPKTADAPKETVSEKKISEPLPVATPPPIAPLAKPEVQREPEPPPRDLGRGGNLHKSIQERLQKEARALGFHSEREKTIGTGNEAVDVVVKRGDFEMAVEIAITTTIDHEFGNVKKCLKAGFSRVAVVSPAEERLKLIEQAVAAGLDAEQAAKVGYYTPEGFIEELRDIASRATDKPDAPAFPDERISKGYKVRRVISKVTEEERRAKEEITIKMMAEAMKRKR